MSGGIPAREWKRASGRRTGSEYHSHGPAGKRYIRRDPDGSYVIYDGRMRRLDSAASLQEARGRVAAQDAGGEA